MIFGPLLLTLQFALATSESNLTPDVLALRQPGIQSDFPSMAIDRQNTPWVAYVEWDGQQDQLCLAKVVDQALTKVMSLGAPGIIHQPALATDGQEGLVVVWSQ
ncbi:MAG: hypothetical protein ACK53L_11950, partial [Pirellulaceae bacterium]